MYRRFPRIYLFFRKMERKNCVQQTGLEELKVVICILLIMCEGISSLKS